MHVIVASALQVSVCHLQPSTQAGPVRQGTVACRGCTVHKLETQGRPAQREQHGRTEKGMLKSGTFEKLLAWRVQLQVTAGRAYGIVVDGFNGGFGEYNISITGSGSKVCRQAIQAQLISSHIVLLPSFHCQMYSASQIPDAAQHCKHCSAVPT